MKKIFAHPTIDDWHSIFSAVSSGELQLKNVIDVVEMCCIKELTDAEYDYTIKKVCHLSKNDKQQ